MKSGDVNQRRYNSIDVQILSAFTDQPYIAIDPIQNFQVDPAFMKLFLLALSPIAARARVSVHELLPKAATRLKSCDCFDVRRRYATPVPLMEC